MKTALPIYAANKQPSKRLSAMQLGDTQSDWITGD